MLTFKEFLIEAERPPSEVANMILENSLPYVNAVGDVEPSTTLFRGTETVIKDFEIRARSQQGGLASKYNEQVASTIDSFFSQKCSGLSLNNLIYTINDPKAAAKFGTPYIVFPIGDFSYAWSKTGVRIPDVISQGDPKKILDGLATANFVCGRCDDHSEDGMEDGRFKQGINSGNEVLISAKGYLPVSLAYWKQFGQQVMEEISMERM